jgi:ATP synthase protein I
MTEPSGPARNGDRFPRYPTADPWTAVSYLISGVLFWGFIGWLFARWLDVPLLTGVGILFGGVAGVYLVWLRYGRPQSGPTSPTGDSHRSEPPRHAERPGRAPSAPPPPSEEETQ